MKKTFSVFLALVLTMVFFGAAVAEDDITGVWYNNSLAALTTLTLNEDGTYSVETPALGEIEASVETGTWDFNGTEGKIDEGTESEASLTLENDVLTLGGFLTFTREIPEAFVPSPVKADAVLEDFAGTWYTDLITMDGITVSPDIAGMDMKLIIEGTNVTVESSLDGTELGEPSSHEGVFADGSLSLIEEAESEDSYSDIRLNILEDGTLSVTLDYYGLLTINFYMSTAE